MNLNIILRILSFTVLYPKWHIAWKGSCSSCVLLTKINEGNNCFSWCPCLELVVKWVLLIRLSHYAVIGLQSISVSIVFTMYTMACMQWCGCIRVMSFKGLSFTGEIKLFHYNSVKQLKTTHQKCVFKTLFCLYGFMCKINSIDFPCLSEPLLIPGPLRQVKQMLPPFSNK